MLIGEHNNTYDLPEENIKKHIKILGITYGENSTKINLDKIYKVIYETIKIWENLNLNFTEKTTILNTYIISKILYVARMIDIPKEHIMNINKLIYKFYWHDIGKHELIKRNTLIQAKEQGGLKIPDIECKIHAMRLQRLQHKQNTPWFSLLIYYIGHKIKEKFPEYAKNKYRHNETLQNKQYINIAKLYTKFKDKINWDKDNQSKIYQKLILENKQETTFKQNNKHIDEMKIYKMINNKTIPQPEIDLLYLILHNGLPTQERLLTRNIHMDKKTCYFCDTEIESNKHLFIECKNLKTTRNNFTNKAKIIINENNILKIQINKQEIMK